MLIAFRVEIDLTLRRLLELNQIRPFILHRNPSSCTLCKWRRFIVDVFIEDEASSSVDRWAQAALAAWAAIINGGVLT